MTVFLTLTTIGLGIAVCVLLYLLKERVASNDAGAPTTSMLNALPFPCFSVDREQRILAANDLWLRKVGLRQKHLTSNALTQAGLSIAYAQTPGFNTYEDQICEPVHFETDVAYPNSIPIRAEIIQAPLVLHDGTPTTLTCIRDLSAQHNTDRAISFMGRHDDLTQLPKRGEFERLFNEKIQRTYEASPSILAVFVLAIDRFKSINDQYGYEQGDRILKQVARSICDIGGPTGLVARLEGNRFALVRKMRSETDIEGFGKILSDAIALPMKIQNTSISVTCSVGTAYFPAQGTSARDVLVLADKALRSIPALERRARVVIYGRDFTENGVSFQRQRIENARENGEFYIVREPIVFATSKQVYAYECLLRWADTKKKITLLPSSFVPGAMEANLLNELGEDSIMMSLENYRDSGDSQNGIKLCLNVFEQQLSRVDFSDWLLDVVYHHNVNPVDIIVDVPESSLVNISDALEQNIVRMSEMGVQVFVDDFGLSKSSLEVLSRLPITGIKIDASLVEGIYNDDAKARTIKTLYSVAINALGENKIVIAEGVSNALDMDVITSVGIPFCQGRLFSPPDLQSAQSPRVDATVISLFQGDKNRT